MPRPFPSSASDLRFGELRERTLHRQLKALYRPSDGEVEWRVAGSVADVWSPTAGVTEIQTATLAKLRPRVAAYLGAGLEVTVVFPLAIHRTLVTMSLTPRQVQAFISCMKKIGVLEVCGQTGRAHLLRRAAARAARET